MNEGEKAHQEQVKVLLNQLNPVLVLKGVERSQVVLEGLKLVLEWSVPVRHVGITVSSLDIVLHRLPPCVEAASEVRVGVVGGIGRVRGERRVGYQLFEAGQEAPGRHLCERVKGRKEKGKEGRGEGATARGASGLSMEVDRWRKRR